MWGTQIMHCFRVSSHVWNDGVLSCVKQPMVVGP